MESLIIAILLMILLTVWLLSVRRKLVGMNENINNTMNQIGVQVFSRFHVLVSLLDIVKEYAQDEAKMLIAEVKIGESAINAESTPNEVIRQEMLISDTLEKMFRVVERYPERKGDKEYIRYIDAMDCYERMIHTSYLMYNDSVAKFNKTVLLFPVNLIARILGFHRRDYLVFTQDRAKAEHNESF